MAVTVEQEDGRGMVHGIAAIAGRHLGIVDAEVGGELLQLVFCWHQRLDAWIDAHFDEQTRFLQALVQVPTDTPPGNNAPHAERTAELLAGFGLEAEKHPVPAQQVHDYGLETLTNLIVRRRYGAGGPVIALNAHGDVVPPGEGWSHDPYGGEVVDGKLYGRAAAVSKSDFATYTFALRALPFVAGQWLQKHPIVHHLGQFLPLAIMTLLLLHQLVGSAREHAAGPWPELFCAGLASALQWRSRNPLLSILAGTGLYVLLRNLGARLLVMPTDLRKVLGENMAFLMRHYKPSPMSGPQREFH